MARLLRWEIARLVERHATPSECSVLLAPHRVGPIAQRAEEDLLALASKDPAAHGSWRYVLDSYAAYRATLAYRVANAVYTSDRDSLGWERRRRIARRISEHAKVETGVEIHPAATIGRRFVLDHGVGTVIGETAVVGHDAYVLQGVVLGARGIANNPTGRRHPCLGERVEVGSFARILGPITIGDDVLVGPCVVITSDVPSQRRVRVVNQYQGTTGQCNVRVFGVVPVEAGVLEVHGTSLAGVQIELLGPNGNRTPAPVLASTDRTIRCAVTPSLGDEQLRLVDVCGAETVIYNLQHQWRELSQLSRA